MPSRAHRPKLNVTNSVFLLVLFKHSDQIQQFNKQELTVNVIQGVSIKK